MTAKEIRLGNIVNYKYWNPNPKGSEWCFEMVEIVGLLQDTFYFKFRNNNSVKKIKELYPIELTEEILLKIKGIKQEGLTFRIGKYIIWQNNANDYMFMVYDIRDENPFSYKVYSKDLCIVKYLHQLQNVFYSLENEELEIKL